MEKTTSYLRGLKFDDKERRETRGRSSGAIAMTGVVQAYIDVRSFHGLLHSTYGALVIVKVVLAAAPAAGVTEVGENWNVAPVGSPETVKFTGPLKPFGKIPAPACASRPVSSGCARAISATLRVTRRNGRA